LFQNDLEVPNSDRELLYLELDGYGAFVGGRIIANQSFWLFTSDPTRKQQDLEISQKSISILESSESERSPSKKQKLGSRKRQR
jgi:hypothetical protein